ncbi:endonuclease I [Photobacterium angustum]|uniref:Endonuclease I n=2 Tax=Photobacterium angustum TaxID=661 RepID=A0ABX5H153_PHOAN|nr:endonuclease [Photobacterium angustum]KJG37783.1 endonuclease I [Photobacterium angustum]PSX07053.1 endonuclease I [Photobacterium angustum]
MKPKFLLYAFIISALASGANASEPRGNTQFDSFNKSKKWMYKIYSHNPRTFYCDAEFKNRKIISDHGFSTDIYQKRALRTEAEHVVPAENFGRSFKEWRDGHPSCIDQKGRAFKGRKCAEKSNRLYRLMQSDMYNLVPAIGAVNAARKNYNFTMLPKTQNSIRSFGTCAMLISSKDRKAQPPLNARGAIARTYLYMQYAYPRYNMSRQQKQLMAAWDRAYPVTDWECKRSLAIERVQGNTNPIVKSRCNVN